MRMDYECYHLERVEDHILIVMMDRPEVANAKNTAMGLEQKEIFENLYTDTDGVRCVILTGRGDKAFCAGGDLKERKGMTDAQWRYQHAVYEQGAMALRNCPVPVIAAVNGAAYGGGCETAMNADFAYASKTARFALTEVTLGIMPGTMGTQNLPHAVGERRAKEIILTGRPFNAEEAFQWGLVNKICEPETLMEETLETARKIAGNAPQSIMRAKRSISVATQVDRATGFQFELEAYNRLVGTEDRLEGVLAFNEKRKPKFTGK
ncbi:MAG: enoyl-CoA hydratase [Rhodospirillaceae bacterium]|jgi:enoyl-CoA hydratase/carnithine racemase|nr:enoyl-CoA hydratase [Rhodospirillales bacterium]MBT3904327.1 enoyl-CoA hydratase [Rhodospirillaceae bacterium]MBT4703565.1 enoyl-CoA hydratase [Rhodospirillaceae bacterium]MBT6220220.1 enoyl-CoA hydratase [Rhodospirillaceae bacterium]MBT6363474.1 enoyl-CoA hydratase [Rhodospirillaceae bacterium]